MKRLAFFYFLTGAIVSFSLAHADFIFCGGAAVDRA